MAKKYFKKKNPCTNGASICWIEMTGQEFYAFVKSPEAEGRHFISLDDDIVIEANADQFRDWLKEKNHSDYLRRCEEGMETISIYSESIAEHGDGEDVLPSGENTEEQAVLNICCQAVRLAMSELDSKDTDMLYKLFFNERKTSERDLAKELGITQQAVHKRKKKILGDLKKLVVKFEKNQQYKVKGKNKKPLT